MEVVEKKSLELLDSFENADTLDAKKSLILKYINGIEINKPAKLIQDSSKLFSGCNVHLMLIKFPIRYVQA